MWTQIPSNCGHQMERQSHQGVWWKDSHCNPASASPLQSNVVPDELNYCFNTFICTWDPCLPFKVILKTTAMYVKAGRTLPGLSTSLLRLATRIAFRFLKIRPNANSGSQTGAEVVFCLFVFSSSFSHISSTSKLNAFNLEILSTA